MSRLNEHLEHIRNTVVPTRGAAQVGLDAAYIAEIEARAQPPLLARGLEQWNAGYLYEQHETLEWLWRATDEPVRDLFKGIIQSGVGGYHVLNRNRKGALGKWTGALGYLAPFDSLHPYAIDVGHLRAQLAEAREALLAEEEPDWEVQEVRVKQMSVRWVVRQAAPRVSSLLRRLDRAWEESPLSVLGNLRGVTEEEATRLPETRMRSIAYLIAHLGVGKAIVAARCAGDEALSFQDVAPPEPWRDLPHWASEIQERLRRVVGFLTEEALDEMRPLFGTTLSLERILEATIEHDIYHAGEINLLRELYRTDKT
ncbi:MAG: DUF309 domain-containing protein [Ardenticatenales bacterium]|nr:DUF309 domain-containing protein [Ardenticatenales bacterium]